MRLLLLDHDEQRRSAAAIRRPDSVSTSSSPNRPARRQLSSYTRERITGNDGFEYWPGDCNDDLRIDGLDATIIFIRKGLDLNATGAYDPLAPSDVESSRNPGRYVPWGVLDIDGNGLIDGD